jgi:hypothetical protein
MSKENLPELAETELDIVTPTGVELNQNKFQAIMQFAEQTEKIGRALDSIRKFTLNRALPGDWVRHGDNLNLSGPAAERVISALALMGVSASFTNWRYWKDTGTDKNGEWFVWFYEADVQIGGLLLEKVQGRAGSRDQFFGYAHGAWKDLADVKESDIRMAARRGVIKEGVKVALGLRSIPVDAAESLGLDPKKIKTVDYAAGAKAPAAAKAGTPLLIVDIKQQKGTNKESGKPWIKFLITDEKKAVYTTFSETLATQAKKLQDAGKKVIFDFTVSKFGNELKAIIEASADAKAPEPERDPSEMEPVG